MSYTETCKGYYSKHRLYWVNIFERIAQKEKVLLRFTILSILLGMLLCYAALNILTNLGHFLVALFLMLLFAYPIYVVGLGVHTLYALISIRLHGVEMK